MRLRQASDGSSPSRAAHVRHEPVAQAGMASIRLMVLMAGLTALAVPMLSALWAGPSDIAPPGVELPGWGWVLLAQGIALPLLLAGVWIGGVSRKLVRARQLAQMLAGGRHRLLPAGAGHWLVNELDELVTQLTRARQRVDALVDEVELRTGDLQRLAVYDALTGLPNRRLFRDLFEHAAAQAQRSGRSMALLYVDLDHLQQINDRHGTPAGDALLHCVARRMQETVRGSDLVGRLGGDEFAVLMVDTVDFDAMALTAMRLIHATEAPVTLDDGRSCGDASASVGVARFPRDGEDFETLLAHADQALYRAKTLGRGRHAVFQPTLNDADQRVAAGGDGELLHALDHGELQLYFQPVIDTVTGQAIGAEALMRWQHPREGLLPPARFIHRAEESGQLHALGLSTLDQACAQVAQWHLMGLRPGRISINVSAPQFRHVHWARELGQALLRHHVAGQDLAVELTESTLMGDAESTQQRVEALRGLGVSLVIDDFGSGLISLARLGELRPAMVKLDASFVRGLPDDPQARAMVAGIVGLARSLSIAVVAESVETEAQRDALAELGCTLQQGYLFARPQPALPDPAWPLPPGGAPTVPGANDHGPVDLAQALMGHG